MLSGASSELGQIADELEMLLTALDRSLAAAGISQGASERSLEASISSATIGIDSLAASQAVLQQAMRARDAELWIWRVATVAGFALALMAALWR
jgi:hypothetical protein